MNRNIELKQDECIDDLQLNELKIIQNNKAFKFGMDAVLLSSFVTVKKNSNVLDLGTGTGILPILLCGKTRTRHIMALEIQSDMVDMAKRSCQLNELEDRITIIQGDLTKSNDYIQQQSIDTVISNPPYKKRGSGLVSESDTKAIARNEIACTLENVVSAAHNALKVGGNFAMVHRPERMADIIATLRGYQLEPKRIQLVYPTIKQPPTLVLVESIKGGNPFVKWEAPLIVRDENGEYTETLKKMYGIEEE